MFKTTAAVFVWSIIAYHIVYGLYLQIMNIINSKKILREQEIREETGEPMVSFVIVVPCWKEQKIIRETIDHFSRFHSSPLVKRVLIVTSESEEATAGKTTYDLAQEHLSTHPCDSFIELIQCSPKLCSKPAKVNYAIRQWISRNGGTPLQYVCMYDADSRPSLRSLAVIAAQVRKAEDAADIYQQVSSYCNNISSIEGAGRLYSLADAVAQTHWALSFEYSLYEENRFCQSHNCLTPPYYLIGHGCFISIDYFRRIGGIPEINHCDDAALGFLSGLLNAKLQVVPVLDTCDVAPTSVASVLQSRSWFHGSNQYNSNLRYFMEKYSIQPSKVQHFYWCMRENLRNFFWGWRAPLLLVAIVLGLVADLPGVMVGGLLAVLFYVEIPYFLTYCTLKNMKEVEFRLRPWELIAGAFMAIPVFLGRCIGPFLGSLEFKKVKNDFTYKTER